MVCCCELVVVAAQKQQQCTCGSTWMPHTTTHHAPCLPSNRHESAHSTCCAAAAGGAGVCSLRRQASGQRWRAAKMTSLGSRQVGWLVLMAAATAAGVVDSSCTYSISSSSSLWCKLFYELCCPVHCAAAPPSHVFSTLNMPRCHAHHLIPKLKHAYKQASRASARRRAMQCTVKRSWGWARREGETPRCAPLTATAAFDLLGRVVLYMSVTGLCGDDCGRLCLLSALKRGDELCGN